MDSKNLIVDDTNYLTENDIFIAKKGKNISLYKLINEAIKYNPKLIISNKKTNYSNVKYIKNIKKYEKNYIKKYTVNPIIIGVTGTNGKTSTSSIIYHILKDNNKKVMLIGSNGVYFKNLYFENRNTTPSKLSILYLINKYLDDSSYVVIELSSQSYNRIKDLKIDYMIFTNLSNEHLDYHKTLKKYYKAKLKIINLLKNKENLFTNLDDKYGNIIFKKYKKSNGYSLKELKILTNNPISFIYNDHIYSSNLSGDFNIYNIISSIKLLEKIIEEEEIVSSLRKEINIIGRNNLILYKNNKIIIDFAHTPYAMECIIKNYSEIEHNKLYILFGFGGNKDKCKRSEMLDIAYKYSNNIVITEDNSRNEGFINIIKSSFFKNYQNIIIIKSRKEAIKYMINKLNENDILLILGKGNEKYIIENNQLIEHNDETEVRKWIN